MKIAVFDSGVGGLTVLRELMVRFPERAFHYFGDTANVPYGTKSVAQIETLCRSAAERIRDEGGIERVVVACNTASSLALGVMAGVLAPLPVLGVVEAGVESVVRAASAGTPNAPILVLGTRATVNSHVYARELGGRLPHGNVSEQACPLLVPMIEEGWRDHPILMATLDEYARDHRGTLPGVALLACTHYPFIREAVERTLPGWNVIDSATAVADQLAPDLGRSLAARDRETTHVVLSFSDPDAVHPHVIDEIRAQARASVTMRTW